MITLKGDRIILTPATLDDRRRIYDWMAHSDITCQMMGPPEFEDNPIPEWEFFKNDYNPDFFNDEDPDQGRSYIIQVNGESVGHINYNEIERSTNTAELDIWMAGSRFCNKGYGSDAIETLCHYLATQLHCTRFVLAPSARNKNAIRAYEKCGFKKSPEIPPGFIPDYADTVVMIKDAKDIP